jgi:glutathione S-transferase
MSQPADAALPVLITFPPSLDSELSRFLVTHYGVQHIEQRHTMIYCFYYTLRAASTLIFPLLYSKSFKLIGPRPISEYFDARCAPELALWPKDETLTNQMESDWNTFNNTLAWASADFAYYYLLPHRDIMIRPLSDGTPANEQEAVSRHYGVFAGLLKLLLRLSPERAQSALGTIRTVFDGVEARLKSGARYLVADRLTMSDLAFAVAAAPMVLPASYGGPIPPFDQMPPEVQAAVTEMRGRPAGAYALRIYAEERNRFGTAPPAPGSGTGQANAAGRGN